MIPSTKTRMTLRMLGVWPNGDLSGLVHYGHYESDVEREAYNIWHAHPLMSGNHARYARAVELVGARHSKHDLIDLVNWLLACAERGDR